MADGVKVASLYYTIEQRGAKQTKKELDSAKDTIKRLGNESKKSSTKLGKFFDHLKRVGTYRAARMVLREISQGFREGVSAMYQWSRMSGTSFASSMDAMSTSLQNIKNSLGVAIAPILENVIIPAVEKLSAVFMSAANAVARFLAILNGQKTYTIAVTGATKKYASAMNEAKKSVLGFDELNVLSGNSGGGGGYSYGDAFKEVDVGGLSKFEQGLSNFGEKFRELKENIKRDLAAIQMFLGAFEFAIGLILLFTWTSPPLGLGMMIDGARRMYKASKMNWDEIPYKVKSVFAEIEAICAISLLAVGAILAFSGANIPLGIGLMIAGAAFAVGLGLQWDKLPDEIKKTVNTIMLVLSGGLLVVGAILALSHANVKVGIGLMVAGAVGLASAAALNWDKIGEQVKSIINSILGFVKEYGLLVVGMVLAFACPAALPLGLAIMALGGVNLATAVQPEWGKGILDGFKNAFAKLTSWWDRTVQPWIDKANKALASIFTTDISKAADSGNSGGATKRIVTYDSSSLATAGHYASGGFTSGDLFWANENGSNEFVGRIGNRSAVANNDQIVEAVSLGVYNAVSAAMNGRNNNMSVKVYLDGREIKASQQRLARATG